MKARRAARELALLSFSQLGKDMQKGQDIDITDIITISVRTLVDDAENSLKNALYGFMEMKEKFEDYEIDHPENEKRPIGSGIIPAPFTMTSDIIGRIDQSIDGIDKALAALELSEISALSNRQEVREFTLRLAKSYMEHSQQIDDQIQKLAKGWNIDRLVRIDRDILRLAIVELLYFKDMPLSVTIDEAVELAKKYSTDESSSFINGILRGVVEEHNLLTNKNNK